MMQHPFMLAWIGGAVVPLVLHLLSRSRYAPVPWGAMMFLTGVDADSHHAARIKQIVLLILRMTAVGLLAVTLARPVIASGHSNVPTAGLTTGGPAAVVIVADDSASMGYVKNGKSRLDQEREMTLQILSALKRGDQAALLLAGSRDNPAVVLSTDLQSIASRMADLQPDIGQADFASDLTRAAALLEHSSPAERDIYLICDSQASSWRNVTDTFKQQWASRHSIDHTLRVTVIPVGGNESDNVAVDAIEIPDQFLIRDRTSMIQVHVHNYGSTSQPSIPVSVWTGARAIFDTVIGVPARSIKFVKMPVRFGETGSRVLSAAITSSGLTSDDRLDSSIDVIDPFQVLIVSDAVQTPTTRATTLPTTQAVAIHHNGEVAVIKTISFSDWSKESLKKFDVIILSDVPELTADQQILLRQFAAAGGGILFRLGTHVNVDNYNQILRPLLPATLGQVNSKAVRITALNRQQPTFRALPNRFDLVAGHYFPVKAATSGSRVLTRFNSGDPWLIETDIDRGRVLLMTADFGLEDQGAVMQAIMRHLGGGKSVDRNLWPGEPIVASIDESVDPRSATVQFAAGAPREPANMIQSADHTEIRYSKTNKPGTYRLRYRIGGKEKLVNYVVAVPRSDSDLKPLTIEQWQTLGNRIGFHRVDLSKTTVADTMNVQRGGREIWIDLLGAVILLMTAEMLLSRLWSN